MKEILIWISSMAVGGLLILRLARKGISGKYDRNAKSQPVTLNSWTALNEGKDPTL